MAFGLQVSRPFKTSPERPQRIHERKWAANEGRKGELTLAHSHRLMNVEDSLLPEEEMPANEGTSDAAMVLTPLITYQCVYLAQGPVEKASCLWHWVKAQSK